MKVARLTASERAVLFNETGAARGLANAIIEKDFWVCWTLKRLFSPQGEGTPVLETASKKKAKALIEALVADVQKHIASVLLPLLTEAAVRELGSAEKGGWRLAIDNEEPQNVNFEYPPSSEYQRLR